MTDEDEASLAAENERFFEGMRKVKGLTNPVHDVAHKMRTMAHEIDDFLRSIDDNGWFAPAPTTIASCPERMAEAAESLMSALITFADERKDTALRDALSKH